MVNVASFSTATADVTTWLTTIGVSFGLSDDEAFNKAATKANTYNALRFKTSEGSFTLSESELFSLIFVSAECEH